MFGQVYLIRNTLNGRGYVGQTTGDPQLRFNRHSNKNEARSTIIARAIRKYGREAFALEVLEICDTREALNDAETRWIATLGTRRPNGYNVAYGGFEPHPPEVRAKLSLVWKGKKRGPHSAEWKAAISAKLKGHRVAPGHSERLRARNALPWTPERRARAAAAKRGQRLTPTHKANFIAAGRIATERLRQTPGYQQGENNSNAKLTWAKVREIRALRPGMTQQALAARFGVTQALISQICLNKIWQEPLTSAD